MSEQPVRWKQGDPCLLECAGEKWLAEIALASGNGLSLAVTFRGTVANHLNMMPLSYIGGDKYRSIIDGTVAHVKPLPQNWLRT